jgi:Domain of unknown function (DUF3854)
MNDDDWKRMRRVLEEDRAVDKDVAGERGYRPFDRGDRWVRDLYPDMSGPQWGATFGRLVRRTSGIVIPKHPVPGTRDISPQLRPDAPVELWAAERHHHDAYPDSVRKRHEAGRKHDGAGVRVEDEHEHPRDPKYLLTPLPVGPIGWFHAHSERTKPGHLTKYHADDPTPDPVHSHHRRDKDRTESREKRLDVHPRTLRMLKDDPKLRVFFSIEGSIKADAILSQGEAALAVPSVAMWPAPELEGFVHEYLADRRVYVVPDADWAQKSEVALQAFVCVGALRRFGADAAVASAPEESGLKGVDDFLAAGGDIGDLTVVRRKLTRAFHDFTAEVRRRREFGEIRARDRLIDVLRFVVLHADESGRCQRMGKTIARHTDLTLRRLEATLDGMDDLTWGIDGGEPFLTYRYLAPDEPDDYWHRRAGGSRYSEFQVRADIRAHTVKRPLRED